MKDIERAYRLLREFKEGKFTEGRALSNEELRLVQILSADLFPSAGFDADNFQEIICALAHEDTKWNRLLGEALDKFYCELEAGKTEAGVNALRTFSDACPSLWYRSLAEIELENLGNGERSG